MQRDSYNDTISFEYLIKATKEVHQSDLGSDSRMILTAALRLTESVLYGILDKILSIDVARVLFPLYHIP